MKKALITILLLSLMGTICSANDIDSIVQNYIDYSTAPTFFSDMEDAEWAAEAVNRLSSYNIIQGSDGYFYPNDNITRAEYVKLIVVSFGLYDESSVVNYNDCTETDWHTPYVASAVKLGIVQPLANTVFGADEFITRQDMFLISYNAMLCAGVMPNQNREPINFADSDEIPEEYAEVVDIMSSSSIVLGTPEGYLYPAHFSTRAEAAVILDKIITASLEADSD